MKSIIVFCRRHYPVIILGIILALGAYLRIWRISEYLTYLGDEGRDAIIVRRMIVDHKFTLLGPTASVGGFFLGPLYYYLMLPFLWLWHFDPTGPAVMVALFGVATIALLYKTAKDMISPVAGLAAASLYAISPLVISYSRSSWNPNIVPFFSLLLINRLWHMSVKRGKLDVLWIGIILGAGIQLHYLFLFLYVIAAVWFLIAIVRRKFTIRDGVLGFGGLCIGASGFLLFELRHGFPNTQSIIKFLLTGKDTGFSLSTFVSNLTAVSYRIFGRLLARLPDEGMLAGMEPWVKTAWISGSILLTVVGFGLLVAGVYVKRRSIWQYVTGKADTLEGKDKAILLFAVWLIGTILMFGFYKRGIYDYYFGIVFSAPFFLVGLMIHSMWKNRMWRWVGLACWVFLLVLNWRGRPFLYEPNNQLAQARKIAEKAIEKTDGKPFNFALVTATNSDHAYRYFFEAWGRAPVTIENSVVDPGRKTVTDQLIVICENPNCQPLGNSLWEIAGFGRAEIVGSWDVPFVKIYKLVHYTP